MRMQRAVWRYLCLLIGGHVVASGCAARRGPKSTVTDSVSSQSAARDLVRANYLGATELRSVTATSTFDAVRKLRPEFIRPAIRAPRGGRVEPAVYLDGVHQGDPEALASIPLAQIYEILMLPEVEARARFGLFCPC